MDRRWTLAWRELRRRPGRHALVVMALVMALVASGVLAISYALVRRATHEGYAASLPVSATLRLEAGQRFDPARLPQHPQLVAGRLRRSLFTRLSLGARSLSAELIQLDDAQRPDIGRLWPEAGEWPVRPGALLLERSAAQAEEFGTQLTVAGQSFAVTGKYRDVSLAPGWMEGHVTLLAGAGVLQQLGEADGFDTWEIRLSDAPSRAAVRRVVAQLQSTLEAQGLRLRSADIPEPGVHIHAPQMESLMLVQGLLALLTLLACGFLVHVLFSTLLRERQRELALLKTLGGSQRELVAMSLLPAALTGVMALVVALPAALWLGQRYAALKLDLLNFPVESAPPAGVVVALVLAGLAVPLLAAALPLRHALRRPVAQALRHGSLLQAAPQIRLPWRGSAARLVQLGLGQVLRQRARSTLTVLALAMAVASFMASANLRAAVVGAVEHIYAPQRHHLVLRLAEPAPLQVLEGAARAEANVSWAEAWTSARGVDDPLMPPVSLLGVPRDSRFFWPEPLQGRWLNDTDTQALVASRALLHQRPDWRLGQTVRLQVNGEPRPWRLVGVAEAGPQAVAWVPRAQLGDESRTLLVALTRKPTPVALAQASQALRARLADQGLVVTQATSQAEGRRLVEDHLLMAVQFLSAVGWMLGAVSALGLAAQLGLSVLEHEREIAVLRALGAGIRQIAVLLGTELLTLLALAWGLALVFAAPLSAALEWGFSRMFFALPWKLWPTPELALYSMALMLAVGAMAAAWPLRRALQVPTGRLLNA